MFSLFDHLLFLIFTLITTIFGATQDHRKTTTTQVRFHLQLALLFNGTIYAYRGRTRRGRTTKDRCGCHREQCKFKGRLRTRGLTYARGLSSTTRCCRHTNGTCTRARTINDQACGTIFTYRHLNSTRGCTIGSCGKRVRTRRVIGHQRVDLGGRLRCHCGTNCGGCMTKGSCL